MESRARLLNPSGRPRAVAVAIATAALGLACAPSLPIARNAYQLVGPDSFLTGHAAANPDGTVNAVIEIPAGSLEKWEVDKADGSLRREFRDGKPRVVDYLGYPGNYGMVPRTLLPAEEGGDGDPLDVLVLGASLPRGSVVPVVVVGVLRLRDGGERDDKLIAVGPGLASVSTLEELETRYPGATGIVETWFTNYKGPGVIESSGYAGADEARAILERAAMDFDARRDTARDGD